MRPMTDAEIAAAAAADPDARPMTDAALGLTQDEFAERFQIPIGTLRDWEQGRVEPDQAAQAYLRAIAGDAAAVQHALEAGPRRQ
jgi:putative transcriptional regulator